MERGSKKTDHSLVGKRGFEPPASASRTLRSTRLSHSPMLLILNSYEIKYNVFVLAFQCGNHKKNSLRRLKSFLKIGGQDFRNLDGPVFLLIVFQNGQQGTAHGQP